jgi:hypothetical protein
MITKDYFWQAKKGDQGSLTSEAQNGYGIAAFDESLNLIGCMLPMGAPGSDDLGSKHPR